MWMFEKKLNKAWMNVKINVFGKIIGVVKINCNSEKKNEGTDVTNVCLWCWFKLI